VTWYSLRAVALPKSTKKIPKRRIDG